MPVHKFDLKAWASKPCRFDEKCTLKYRGKNSHEVVAVVQAVSYLPIALVNAAIFNSQLRY